MPKGENLFCHFGDGWFYFLLCIKMRAVSFTRPSIRYWRFLENWLFSRLIFNNLICSKLMFSCIELEPHPYQPASLMRVTEQYGQLWGFLLFQFRTLFFFFKQKLCFLVLRDWVSKSWGILQRFLTSISDVFSLFSLVVSTQEWFLFCIPKLRDKNYTCHWEPLLLFLSSIAA